MAKSATTSAHHRRLQTGQEDKQLYLLTRVNSPCGCHDGSQEPTCSEALKLMSLSMHSCSTAVLLRNSWDHSCPAAAGLRLGGISPLRSGPSSTSSRRACGSASYVSTCCYNNSLLHCMSALPQPEDNSSVQLHTCAKYRTMSR
jgi:hypothetical protein